MPSTTEGNAADDGNDFRLPPFWGSDPELWFRQAESLFATANPPIADDAAKFDLVVGRLDNVAAAEVSHLIAVPPTTEKYEALRAELVAADDDRSQAQRDAELLSLIVDGIGDMRPTELLRYMRALNNDPETIFKALFLSVVPVEVRGRMALSIDMTLEQLAAEADRVVEVDRAQAAAAEDQERAQDLQGFDSPDACFYHERFGRKARRCKGVPCPHYQASAAGALPMLEDPEN